MPNFHLNILGRKEHLEKANDQSLLASAHSESMQEIIGHVPNSLTRWGITGVLVVLIGFFVFSFFIKYPDLVEAPLYLKFSSSPKAVVPRIDGIVDRLIVKEGTYVKKSSPLVYLQSTARYNDIDRMLYWVNNIAKKSDSDSDYPLLAQESYVNISRGEYGEVQSSLQQFNAAFVQYVSFLKKGFYEKKRLLLEKDIAFLNRYEENIYKQNILREKDYNFSKQELDAQANLFNSKVIAEFDFKREQAKILSKEIAVRQGEAELVQSLRARNSKEEELLELNKLINEQKTLFLAALNTFRSSLLTWRQNYIISSPVSGIVHFNAELQGMQVVSAKQDLFYITSSEKDIYGEIKIPQYNFGKVTSNQKVVIKFHGYPSQQFGSVQGRIAFISNLPLPDGSFIAHVSLPQGLVTSHSIVLHGKVGMQGTAEIVTEDLRLIDRFIQRVRKITNQ
jgi:multidrug efflux pump subunit AcrA (membrane-fusion protein)